MKPSSRMVFAWTAVAACAGATLPLLGADQPPPPAHKPQDDARETNPEKMRERLERALKESEQAQEKLRAALDRLAKGDDPADVRRDLEMPFLRLLLARDAPSGPMGPGGRLREGPGDRDDRNPGDFRGPAREDRERAEPGQASRPMGPGRLGRPGGPGLREGLEGRGEPGGRGEFSPGERDRLFAAIEKDLPEVAVRVKEVREKHPQLADRMLQRLAPRVRDVLKARESDPELFKLRRDELRGGLAVLEAIHASRQAQLLDDEGTDTATKRAEAAKALRDAVANAFDQRLKLDEHEATRVSERLNDIRAEIEKKKAEKDRAVDDIVRRISRGEMPPP